MHVSIREHVVNSRAAALLKLKLINSTQSSRSMLAFSPSAGMISLPRICFGIRKFRTQGIHVNAAPGYLIKKPKIARIMIPETLRVSKGVEQKGERISL